MAPLDGIKRDFSSLTEARANRRDVLRRAAGLSLAVPALAALGNLPTGISAKGQAAPGGNEPKGPKVDKLVFWTRASPDDPGDPNTYTQLEAVANAYKEKIGTNVELVTVPDADFRSRMDLAAPGGEGPDAFGTVAHDWVGEFAVQKIALEIPESAIQSPQDFLPQSFDAAKVDGKLYGLPMFLESVALIYNKDLVSEVPKTWDELVKMATEMTNEDDQVYGFGFPLLDQYYEGAFLHGFGGYIFKYNDGIFNTEDIGLNSPGGVDATKFLRDMYHKKLPPMPEVAIDRANMAPAQEGMMEAGQIAMTISGPWRETNLKAAGINFGVAKLPTLPNGQPMKPFYGAQVVLANAYGKQQEAALDFISYLSGTDSAAELFKSENKVPTRLSTQQSETVKASTTTAAWTEQIQDAVPMPNIAAMQQVWRPWEAAVDSIIPPNAADPDVKGLLDNAVEQIKQAIAESQS